MQQLGWESGRFQPLHARAPEKGFSKAGWRPGRAAAFLSHGILAAKAISCVRECRGQCYIIFGEKITSQIMIRPSSPSCRATMACRALGLS